MGDNLPNNFLFLSLCDAHMRHCHLSGQRYLTLPLVANPPLNWLMPLSKVMKSFIDEAVRNYYAVMKSCVIYLCTPTGKLTTHVLCSINNSKYQKRPFMYQITDRQYNGLQKMRRFQGSIIMLYGRILCSKYKRMFTILMDNFFIDEHNYLLLLFSGWYLFA